MKGTVIVPNNEAEIIVTIIAIFNCIKLQRNQTSLRLERGQPARCLREQTHRFL